MNDHVMLETSTGAYAVSPGLIKRVAYQAAYYGHKNRTKRRTVSKDGWGLPETYHYEFDFKGARVAAKAAANKMTLPGSVRLRMGVSGGAVAKVVGQDGPRACGQVGDNRTCHPTCETRNFNGYAPDPRGAGESRPEAGGAR